MEEVWKDIPGYEGLYSISSFGRVKSLITGKIRKDFQTGHGYRAIQLSDARHKKKHHYIHRLVAISFLGDMPSSNAQVNHINCDKTDNSVANLEWSTNKENMHHAYMMGRIDYRRPLRKDNKTGYKGVFYHSGGYEVTFCGKYIGWFKDIEKAIRARKRTEEEYENSFHRHRKL